MGENNNKNPIEDFNANMREHEELLRKKREIEKARTEEQYSRMVEADKDVSAYESISLLKQDPKRIEKLQQENEEYIRNARSAMGFICDEFKGVVPFFPKNLLILGAVSGEGKSTATANIALSTLMQGKRVLVLTNEEKVEDCYNRVTCLIKGWPYVDHDRIEEWKIPVFNEYIDKLSKRMTVIDNNYGGNTGVTTTIEGIRGLLDGLIRDSVQYDVVILDYYQNVSFSRRNVKAESWQVQEQLARYLDGFKNSYRAPIVVMAQLMPNDKEGKTPFKQRIEGRKSLYNPCTMAMEIRADREKYRTEWVIHKSRYSSAIGMSFFTGYAKGRYVSYDKKFILESEERAMRRDIFNKEEKKDES